MSQPPRNKPPVRQVSSRSGGNSGGQSSRNYSSNRPRNVPPQRDPFPYIMGGVIGALVVGLMLVIFLLVNNNKTNNPGPIASNTVDPNVAGVPTIAPAGDPPPRMAIEEFKTLYDSANRPLIIDVRAPTAFEEGHIAGAVSFPEVDVDGRIKELPKDKLIVAYCQ
ncbi:MAG: rhodanese-like domain-containing protein [Chloroflexota bacterium]